jgi:hypothetical protein
LTLCSMPHKEFLPIRATFKIDLSALVFLTKELKLLQGYAHKIVVLKFSDGFYTTPKYAQNLKVKVDYSKLCTK